MAKEMINVHKWAARSDKTSYNKSQQSQTSPYNGFENYIPNEIHYKHINYSKYTRAYRSEEEREFRIKATADSQLHWNIDRENKIENSLNSNDKYAINLNNSCFFSCNSILKNQKWSRGMLHIQSVIVSLLFAALLPLYNSHQNNAISSNCVCVAKKHIKCYHWKFKWY